MYVDAWLRFTVMYDARPVAKETQQDIQELQYPSSDTLVDWLTYFARTSCTSACFSCIINASFNAKKIIYYYVAD